jgi:hypothetical protein
MNSKLNLDQKHKTFFLNRRKIYDFNNEDSASLLIKITNIKSLFKDNNDELENDILNKAFNYQKLTGLPISFVFDSYS